MSTFMSAPVRAFSFNNTHFNVVEHNDQIWLTSAEIAKALGYTDEKSVSNLYARNADEFLPSMSMIINLMTVTGDKPTRVFSLRGAHLVAMFARTPIAKEFRKWVLDILDRETASENATPIPSRIPQRLPALPQTIAKVSADTVHRFPFGHYVIRGLRVDGRLWFAAEDLRVVFGYARKGSLTWGVSEDTIRVVEIDGRPVQVINERGLFQIVGKRHVAGRSSKVFSAWLVYTVIPAAATKPETGSPPVVQVKAVPASTRQNTKALCHHMRAVARWWNQYKDALRVLNPDLTRPVNDHFTDGLVACGLVENVFKARLNFEPDSF